MSRIRTIKPEFFKHEPLYELEAETRLPIRLAFAGLWTVCDREGRFHWRPRSIKAEVLPYDDVDFSSVLDALALYGFVRKYSYKGEYFGWIPSWNHHQAINGREPKSHLPEPQESQFVQVSEACVTRALTRDFNVNSRDADTLLTRVPRVTGEGRKEGRKEGTNPPYPPFKKGGVELKTKNPEKNPIELTQAECPICGKTQCDDSAECLRIGRERGYA